MRSYITGFRPRKNIIHHNKIKRSTFGLKEIFQIWPR